MAHFQLGLLNEKRGKTDVAIEHYARAFEINDRLLDVRINPRILDTELVDRALLAKYERTHARKSASFQATPAGYLSPRERKAQANGEAGRTDEPDMPAASPEAPPSNIISPAPSAQDLAKTQPGGTTPAPAEVPTPRRVVRPTDPGPETQAPHRDDDGQGGPGFSVLPNASGEAHAP